jgi:hypothetical protein
MIPYRVGVARLGPTAAFGVEGTVVVSGVQANNSSGSLKCNRHGWCASHWPSSEWWLSVKSLSFQSALIIPDGAVGVAEIGNAFASLPITVEVTGVEADTATEFGWGRGVWSQGEWSEPTGGAGQVQVGVGDIVRPDGVQADGSVGTLTATGTSNVPATGIEADALVGIVRIEANVVAIVGGTGSTASVGVASVFADHVVVPSGVQATVEVGQAISPSRAHLSFQMVSLLRRKLELFALKPMWKYQLLDLMPPLLSALFLY